MYKLYSCLLVSSTLYCTNVTLQEIGHKVWQNECAGSVAGLTSWNTGEDCASMGIGHCIWYPKNKKTNFTETFPELLLFIENRGKKIPNFINKSPNRVCPWNTRDEFIDNQNSPEMLELRQFLVDTLDAQILFLEKKLHTFESDNKNLNIKKQYNRVLQSPNGLYALIDYLNFKGAGTSPKERYNGYGWGLFQVLETMQGTEPGVAALQEFARAAEYVLERRVKNAPFDRHEERWLRGWKNRIKTYTK